VILSRLHNATLILIVFFTVTIGIGSPYAAIASQAFNTIGCPCCTLKEAGCKRCAKGGHHHAKKTKKKRFGCHESEKDHKSDKKNQTDAGQDQLDELPCGSNSKTVVGKIIQDPFFVNSLFEVSNSPKNLNWTIQVSLSLGEYHPQMLRPPAI